MKVFAVSVLSNKLSKIIKLNKLNELIKYMRYIIFMINNIRNEFSQNLYRSKDSYHIVHEEAFIIG